MLDDLNKDFIEEITEIDNNSVQTFELNMKLNRSNIYTDKDNEKSNSDEKLNHIFYCLVCFRKINQLSHKCDESYFFTEKYENNITTTYDDFYRHVFITNYLYYKANNMLIYNTNVNVPKEFEPYISYRFGAYIKIASYSCKHSSEYEYNGYIECIYKKFNRKCHY